MKIEANTTLYARSLGDHNCIFDVKVFGRTAKTADILDIYGNRRKANFNARSMLCSSGLTSTSRRNGRMASSISGE